MRTTAIISVFCASAVVLAQSQTGISLSPAPDPTKPALVGVSISDVPAFTTITSATWQGTATVGTAQFNLAAPPQVGSDKMLLRIHFADAKVLIACLGTAFLPNICTPGQGAVINVDSNTTIAVANVSINGSAVTIQFSGDFTTYAPLWATSSYESPKTDAPSDPGSNALFAECASSWAFAAAPLMTDVAFWIAPGDGREIPIPPAGAQVPPYGAPRPGDLNGDGHNDFDFPKDFLFPGTGDMMLDRWVIDNPPYGPSDNDYIVYVIGHDTNHDGHLQASEVSHIIGQCAFVPGYNSATYEVVNGVIYVHVRNRDNQGHLRHFIYNTQTGILKVYNEAGKKIYEGPPDGYPWGNFSPPWGVG